MCVASYTTGPGRLPLHGAPTLHDSPRRREPTRRAGPRLWCWNEADSYVGRVAGISKGSRPSRVGPQHQPQQHQHRRRHNGQEPQQEERRRQGGHRDPQLFPYRYYISKKNFLSILTIQFFIRIRPVQYIYSHEQNTV